MEKYYLIIMGTNGGAISKRFLNGLELYNLDIDELKADWKYCGGSEGRHLRYFELSCPDEYLPEHETNCICGHKIHENCYLTNGEEILTLGNCCIQRFLPYSGRMCRDCSRPHKSRRDNLCKACSRKLTRREVSSTISFD